MKKSSMFWKMLNNSFRKRKSRIFVALFAIVLGTAVISGLLNVYYDISVKMGKEFRSYGANMVVAPGGQGENNVIREDVIKEVMSILSKENVIGYTPNLYGVAEVKKQKLVVVGTKLDQLKKVSPYLEITGNTMEKSNSSEKVYVGKAVAEKLELEIGQRLLLKDDGSIRTRQVTVAGIVTSGDVEDNQIFLGLTETQELFDKEGLINVAYFSVMTKGQDLETKTKAINTQISGIEARSIKQISQSETVILEKIRSLVYLVVSIILLSTLLCVATTMMTTVVERKREIGLKKALGAQNKSIMVEFLSEGAMLGLLGGIVGIILGFLLAQVIGQSVFKSYISFRMLLVPIVILVSLVVTSLASILPVRTAANVEPAIVLKGE